jgi:hypothetical protein
VGHDAGPALLGVRGLPPAVLQVRRMPGGDGRIGWPTFQPPVVAVLDGSAGRSRRAVLAESEPDGRTKDGFLKRVYSTTFDG